MSYTEYDMDKTGKVYDTYLRNYPLEVAEIKERIDKAEFLRQVYNIDIKRLGWDCFNLAQIYLNRLFVTKFLRDHLMGCNHLSIPNGRLLISANLNHWTYYGNSLFDSLGKPGSPPAIEYFSNHYSFFYGYPRDKNDSGMFSCLVCIRVEYMQQELSYGKLPTEFNETDIEIQDFQDLAVNQYDIELVD